MTTAASFRERYGPWALVAGAGEGLGAAWAAAMASRGLHVVMLDHQPEPLGTLATTLARDHAVETVPAVIDLARADVVDAVATAVGPRTIGLLVYNAALSHLGSFFDVTRADVDRLTAVNCRGPALLAHHFGAAMRARRRGGIILMASLSGMQGNPLLSHYGASKAFNLTLAEGLWDECRADGVDVMAVCPGATRTPGYLATRPAQTGRFAPPEMEPRAVVEEALAAFGHGPSMVPGRGNRIGAFAMRHFMSRTHAVTMMGRIARSLQRRP